MGSLINGSALGEMNVKIEQEYTRAAKGGTGAVKAAGNYAASFYPTKLAREEGFSQIIWTDAENHEYLEEAGTMNIWLRIGEKLDGEGGYCVRGRLISSKRSKLEGLLPMGLTDNAILKKPIILKLVDLGKFPKKVS